MRDLSFGDEEVGFEPSTTVTTMPTAFKHAKQHGATYVSDLGTPVYSDQTGNGPIEAKAPCASSAGCAPMYPNEAPSNLQIVGSRGVSTSIV